MSDRETFGPRLRAERERRGISLDTIASVTNVSAELWEGLERNDFTRWPSGIFARAFVRDYARAIGLAEAEVVDEFCRRFPNGDRRANRIIEAHARIIGHQANVLPDAGGLPAGGDRRVTTLPPAPQSPRATRRLLAPRILAAVVDGSGVLLLAAATSFGLHVGFYESAGVVAVLYYSIATLTFGSSAGTFVVSALRQRLPALFQTGNRHGAHA